MLVEVRLLQVWQIFCPHATSRSGTSAQIRTGDDDDHDDDDGDGEQSKDDLSTKP